MKNEIIDHTDFINFYGGQADDKFVYKPGVCVIAKTKMEQVSHYDNFNKIEDYNARITYLSNNDKTDYVDNIMFNYGHNISHGHNISLIIVGIKESTLMEFVSSSKFKCSRLTTSKTNAQNNHLYCVDQHNIEYTKEFLKLRESYLNNNLDLSIEKRNEFALETKAMSFTLHGEIVSLINYCIGKISEPYEYELQNICYLILNEMLKDELGNKILNHKKLTNKIKEKCEEIK